MLNFITFISLLSLPLQATKLKPMNIEPGLWKSETKMDNGGMIAQMLEKFPAAQRDMMKDMMEKKMKEQLPITEVCFTKEMVSNPQKVYEEQMAQNKGKCDFKVKESTSTKFTGSMTCKGQAFTSDFTWQVIDKKNTKSVVNTTIAGGMKQKILVTSKWVKSKCTPKKI